MAYQVSPGVNITEKDLTTVVPNVSTNIGGFAGRFTWGPVNERTTITTENDLVELFGKPDTNTQEWFWCAANYLAYANNLIVVRSHNGALNGVVGDDDTGTALAVENSTHYDSLTYTDQLFIAKYPGVKGNSLKVTAIDSNGWADATVNADFLAHFDSAPGTSADVANANGSASFVANDEMHVLVIDEDGLFTGVPGEVLERWAYVSKASDAKKIDGSSNYVVDVLKNESKYVYVGLVTQFTTNTTGSEKAAGLPKAGGAFLTFNSATASESVPGGSLAGGTDGSALAGSHLIAANVGYGLFTDKDTVDITLIIGGPGISGTDTTVSAYCVNSVAAYRKDCIAFVSPAKDSVVHSGTNQVTDITGNKTAMSANSSYGTMDSAWKYQYDRYQDKFIWVPMCGDVAGLCAKVDHTHDAWWSPAGLTRGTIKNIIKTSWEPTKANRDTLYKAGINPFITQTGSGVILWGDKTMQSAPTAFDRINVRRLFIVLEKAIENAAKSMLFEFNDEFTRSQFVNMVEPFLREVQGRRGITDFKVVCDGSNNTGTVIDANNFVGDIYVKPTRSINFIQLNFIAARSDISFTEIGG